MFSISKVLEDQVFRVVIVLVRSSFRVLLVKVRIRRYSEEITKHRIALPFVPAFADQSCPGELCSVRASDKALSSSMPDRECTPSPNASSINRAQSSTFEPPLFDYHLLVDQGMSLIEHPSPCRDTKVGIVSLSSIKDAKSSYHQSLQPDDIASSDSFGPQSTDQVDVITWTRNVLIRMTYDVAIIGAGPCSLATAIRL